MKYLMLLFTLLAPLRECATISCLIERVKASGLNRSKVTPYCNIGSLSIDQLRELSRSSIRQLIVAHSLTLSAERAVSPQREVESEALKNWEEKNAPLQVKEEAGFSDLITKTLLLLIGILAALFIATWFMKKMDRFKLKTVNAPSRIELIEKKVLSPKSVLYIIEMDGHTIALAESATNGIQLLQPLPFQDKKSSHPL